MFYEDFEFLNERDPELYKLLIEMNSYLEELKDRIDYFYALVPSKYKKTFPKNGENPFFSKNDIHYDAQDLEDAKKRMADLLKRPI